MGIKMIDKTKLLSFDTQNDVDDFMFIGGDAVIIYSELIDIEVHVKENH